MLTIGYWEIKGRIEPIRYLLHYLKIPHTEKSYPTFSSWFKIKHKIGLPFPNLPYLIDSEIKLTETHALEDYIILKSKNKELLGKNKKDRLLHTMVREIIKDISTAIFYIAFQKDYKKGYLKKRDFVLKKKLRDLSLFLGDKLFFLGYLSFSDFMFAYCLDILMKVEEFLNENFLVDGFENLKGVYQRVRNVDGVREYLEYDERSKYPFFKKGAAKIPL